ncbi:hypothetical protein DFP72DRAFT_835423 [Ephemerocybe angulata]|uniref:DUF6533 domain-containing protein n=1 Tax=Ephemerocybe angulata TaxID=980116 RepID=A0A8H6H5W6_9AGAR|nr:hypothetical protein DFP72DRAFT_835423 [Tulosesus angulatus]
MDPPNAAQLANVAHDLMAAKMYSLASCVMLFYDIVITMGDEVEKIWMQPRYTHITLLYALNRYLSPLGYIVIIASFHMNWPVSTCERYVLYPEALKVVTTFVIGLIFVLRVYAIYGKNKLVGCAGGALLAAELGVKIWAFLDGGRLHLPEGLHGCILVGKHPTRLAFTWIAELVFDTIIFSMTLYRTVAHYRGQQRGRPQSLLKLIMRDGVTYFAVIFIVNAITVSIFIVRSPSSNIKAINASFSTLYNNKSNGLPSDPEPQNRCSGDKYLRRSSKPDKLVVRTVRREYYPFNDRKSQWCVFSRVQISSRFLASSPSSLR